MTDEKPAYRQAANRRVCAACDHIEAHHGKQEMAFLPYDPRCQWRGCGCPRFVLPSTSVTINGVPATWSNEKQSWVPCGEPVDTRGPETPREVTSAVERGLDNLHAYDCWDDDHSGCIEIVRAVLGIPRPKCPVPCDDDCHELCHEAHNVRRKREHEPDDCPAVTGGSTPKSDDAIATSADPEPTR